MINYRRVATPHVFSVPSLRFPDQSFNNNMSHDIHRQWQCIYSLLAPVGQEEALAEADGALGIL